MGVPARVPENPFPGTKKAGVLSPTGAYAYEACFASQSGSIIRQAPRSTPRQREAAPIDGRWDYKNTSTRTREVTPAGALLPGMGGDHLK
jgi:hypothetical protein